MAADIDDAALEALVAHAGHGDQHLAAKHPTPAATAEFLKVHEVHAMRGFSN
jgi:hypothetical protein